jgi:DNA-binding transcriptional regulator LsrR (DeoR family)
MPTRKSGTKASAPAAEPTREPVDLDDPRNLAELARRYFNKRHSRRVSQDEIADEFNIKQSTVSVWLERARERGVVLIDIDPEFAVTGSEYREYSRQLRDDYGLKRCVVVDPGRRSMHTADRKDDDLHTIIANTSGIEIREWIQSAEHVVIGGGRAPVKVARFIKRTPPSRREVRISPLSGRIWTGSWQQDGEDNLQRPLDADDAARLLAFAFEHEPGTRFSQIGHPLYEKEELVEQTIREECVFKPGGEWNTTWGLQPPARALVGVGVLHRDSGHRITELLKQMKAGSDRIVAEHLKWAAARFEEAMGFAEQSELPAFGDVANRLFPALPLPADLLAKRSKLSDYKKGYRKLVPKLHEINKRAVVMEWRHLRGIASVWAVAGGRFKREVLWTLLICRLLEKDRANSIVKELSTDLASAEYLIKARRDFDKLPEDLQTWYQEMVPTVFSEPGEN